jgi:ubiquinone/menaquinone biosynthesis C-methylase UbiE
MNNTRTRVCPVERANSLDNKIRKWFQNPGKILAPYIKEGMKVLDVGCGPGFFSIEIAKMVGTDGKVFSADLQEGMLEKVKAKTKGTELENRVIPVKCDKNKINLTEKVDFVLAFYMVHEVPDKASFFNELKTVLKENGKFLIVEPKLFHVSKDAFQSTVNHAEKAGFIAYTGPNLPFSQTVVLRKN